MGQYDTALKLLDDADITAEETREAVIKHETSYLSLARALDFLRAAKILTVKNVKILLAPEQECLRTGDNRFFWYPIPNEFKNESTWNKILTLCGRNRTLNQIKQGFYELMHEDYLAYRNRFFVKQDGEPSDVVEYQEVTSNSATY